MPDTASNGHTPSPNESLLIAAKSGDSEAMMLALDKGADIYFFSDSTKPAEGNILWAYLTSSSPVTLSEEDPFTKLEDFFTKFLMAKHFDFNHVFAKAKDNTTILHALFPIATRSAKSPDDVSKRLALLNYWFYLAPCTHNAEDTSIADLINSSAGGKRLPIDDVISWMTEVFYYDHSSARLTEKRAIRWLLRNGANFKLATGSQDGTASIFRAVHACLLAAIELLHENGVDLNKERNERGWVGYTNSLLNALCSTTYLESIEPVLKYLLAHTDLLLIKDEHNRYPVQVAAKNLLPAHISLLLAHSPAQAFSDCDHEESLLYSACVNPNDEEAMLPVLNTIIRKSKPKIVTRLSRWNIHKSELRATVVSDSINKFTFMLEQYWIRIQALPHPERYFQDFFTILEESNADNKIDELSRLIHYTAMKKAAADFISAKIPTPPLPVAPSQVAPPPTSQPLSPSPASYQHPSSSQASSSSSDHSAPVTMTSSTFFSEAWRRIKSVGPRIQAIVPDVRLPDRGTHGERQSLLAPKPTDNALPMRSLDRLKKH